MVHNTGTVGSWQRRPEVEYVTQTAYIAQYEKRAAVRYRLRREVPRAVVSQVREEWDGDGARFRLTFLQ